MELTPRPKLLGGGGAAGKASGCLPGVLLRPNNYPSSSLTRLLKKQTDHWLYLALFNSSTPSGRRQENRQRNSGSEASQPGFLLCVSWSCEPNDHVPPKRGTSDLVSDAEHKRKTHGHPLLLTSQLSDQTGCYAADGELVVIVVVAELVLIVVGVELVMIVVVVELVMIVMVVELVMIVVVVVVELVLIVVVVELVMIVMVVVELVLIVVVVVELVLIVVVVELVMIVMVVVVVLGELFLMVVVVLVVE
ncbi:unnamed protein product [Lota lota]